MPPPPFDPSAPNPPRAALRMSVLSALAAMAVSLGLIGARMSIDGDFDRAPRLVGTFTLIEAPGGDAPDAVCWTVEEREVNNPTAFDRHVRGRGDEYCANSHFSPSTNLPLDASDAAARSIGFVGDVSVVAWLIDAIDRSDGLDGCQGAAFRARAARDGTLRCVVGLVTESGAALDAWVLEAGLVSVRSVDPRAVAPFEPRPWDRPVWVRTHAAGDDDRRIHAVSEVPPRLLEPDPWAYRWSRAQAMIPAHLQWGGLVALSTFCGAWAYRWRYAAFRAARRAASVAASLDRFLTTRPQQR